MNDDQHFGLALPNVTWRLIWNMLHVYEMVGVSFSLIKGFKFKP